MKLEQQGLIYKLKEQRSARKYLAIAVCLIAVLTVFAVFWSLRISGLTLGETATETDATGTDATATDGEEESGRGGEIAAANEESGIMLLSSSPSGTQSDDPADYYLAYTVDGVPSAGNYLIYTYSEGVYYVLNKDGSLSSCTPISSIAEATDDGPYYVTSTGTIVYGTSTTAASAYSAAQWTLAQYGSDSSSYTITNTSDTSKYVAAMGDATIEDGFSARTGEVNLSGDFTLTYTFTNFGDLEKSGDNFNNYIVEINNGNGVYIDVRADNYGWLSGATDGAELAFGSSTVDWSTWLAKMTAGTECTVTITRSENEFKFTCVAADVTFTASVISTDFDGCSANVYLTGEQCELTNVVYTYTQDGGSTYTNSLTSGVSALVSELAGYVTITNQSAGTAITKGNYAAVVSGASATWNEGGTATVFYFAAVRTTADNYHFTDAVTLTDAAAKQDESYVVYTQIDGTYYIVSAVDGSLLECTDISSSSYSNDDKALLSAGVGVYIWSYDSYGEPVFKFTTGTDDNDVDYFDDYRWTINSSNYGANGDGTYTLYDEENDDYLAPQLDVATDTLVRSGNNVQTSTYKSFTSGYGTIEYTVAIDSAYTTGGKDYVWFCVFICNNYNNTNNRYIRLGTPNVEVGTDWADVPDSAWMLTAGASAYTLSSYGVGSMTLNVEDTLTITVITADDCMYVNFYNEDTKQTYVRVITYSVGPSFGTYGTTAYIQNQYGNLTVSTVTYSPNSSYGVSNSISGDGSTTLSDGSLSVISGSEMNLSGDFDITYSLTNVSNTAALASGASAAEITAAAEDNFAIELTDGTNTIYVKANNEGWITTNGTVSTASTFYTYGSDSSSVDWSTFVAAMCSGATCTVRVIRTGNNFAFILTATPTDSSTYPDTYTFVTSVTASEFTEGSTISAYLEGENCTISNASYTDNTARERNDKEYRRISYVTEDIEITSTSDAYEWEVSAVGYYSEDFVLIAQLAEDSANTAEIEWVDKSYASSGATSTGSATTTLGGETTANLSNTVVVTLSLARVREYTAWFDGTNGGMVTNNSTDTPVVSSSNATGTTFTVTAPTATSPTYISYDLRGWYDIYTSKYYEPGETFEITDHTVLYADWKVASYDIGQENSHTVDSVSTDSFADIYLFDFGELFNLYSTELIDSVYSSKESEGVTYGKTFYTAKSAGSHSEVFSNVSLTSTSGDSAIAQLGSALTLDFLFFRSETSRLAASNTAGYVNLDAPRIDYPVSRTDRNKNPSDSSATQNIIGTGGETNLADISLLETLFGMGNTVDDVTDKNSSGVVYGKTYVGNADYLFQYDSASGYYYYDSAKNAASYNQSDKRFYVYDYLTAVNSSSSTSDFLPYNYVAYENSYSYATEVLGLTEADTDITRYKLGTSYTNYWFGMSTEISFYLPSDVDSSDNQNLALNGTNHMTFKFSGDDDVWVFVDDVLVLDLGGVHGVVYGEIDFYTGEVVVVNDEDDITYNATYTNIIDYDPDGTSVVPQTDATNYVKNLEAGTHTLTFYYLERGSGQSNAAIYTNIGKPTYNLTLNKVNEDGTNVLDGAEFTFFTDNTFTTKVELATEQGGDPEESTFSAGATAYGLQDGKTYYVRETASPSGYTSAGKYFTVYLSSNVLTITVYDSAGTALEKYTYTIGYDSQNNTFTYTYAADSSVTDTSTWSYILADARNASIKETVTGGAISYYDVEFKVANTKEYEIPVTGSVGTDSYRNAGMALAFAGAVGLLMIAFYRFVWVRKLCTNNNIKGYTKDRRNREKRGKHFTRTRDHPRQRRHPRRDGGIQNRNAVMSSANGGMERRRATGPG